jgi:hypothetical protein
MANGLNSANGLYSTSGYMTNEHGRMIVQYLARCALPSGTNLVKSDQYGINYTFGGGLGLAPTYYSGGCGPDCSQALSACMMAHINSSGTHIPLWMDSPDSSVGWGVSPAFPTREGTFFGQLMVTNAENNLDAYYCNGPGVDQNVVPGRLGADQGTVPYANAYPTAAGMDGLCDTTHVVKGYDHGHCTPHLTNGVEDGETSCALNGATYTHPLTVWRGATYQAETAQPVNFTTFNCTPGTNYSWGACPVQADPANGMGKRVGYVNGTTGVQFNGVTVANSGADNIIVYYENGDAFNQTRYFAFSVNGGTTQVKAFGGLGNWQHPRGAAITLSGFKAGSSNTIKITGDGVHQAPDIDWIEVVDTSATVPSTGLCQPSLWNITTSANTSTASIAVNGNSGDRWTTSRSQQTGDYYQIDFTGTVNLSTVTLNNNSDGATNDYPGTYAVYTSQDGVTFGATPVATGPGAPGQTIISFTQESLQAIRIKVTGARTSNWWSIGEITTDCSLAF